jgi:hypothetical protein
MFAVWTAGEWYGLPWVWWLVIGCVAALGVFGLLNGAVNRIYRPVDGLVQGVVGRMGAGKSLFITQRVLLPYCRTVGKKGFLNSSTSRPMVRAVTNFRFDSGTGVEVRTVSPGADQTIFRSLIDLAAELGELEGPWLDYDGILHAGRDGSTGEIRPMPDLPPRELPNGLWAFERQPILNALVILDEMHLFCNSGQVSLGDDAGYIISMARKLNCELWWLSQHEMKVHKRLRDESSSIWLAGKVQGSLGLIIGSGQHMAREYLSPALVERARSCAGTTSAPRPSDKRLYRYTSAVGRVYNSFELLVPDPTRKQMREAGQAKRPAVPAGRLQAELVASGAARLPDAGLPVVTSPLATTDPLDTGPSSETAACTSDADKPT